MTELSDNAIALLSEIEKFSPNAASDEQKTHLDELLRGGFIKSRTAPDGEPRYVVTGKAADFMSARGGSLNES